MRRRTLLASSALAVTTTAGCLGLPGGSGDEAPDDGSSGSQQTPADGYAPDSVESPEQMDVDTDSFERIEVEGESVPLAPIDVTYNWYARQEARFVDARGQGQYDASHIEGAAWSPAPDGRDDDPVEGWSTGDRIVCYCGCPHHLSALRASTLISAGYEDVYVIDEGFHAWTDQEYPVAGSNVEERASARVIHGQSDASLAGEPVYATHASSDQREANFVRDDGSYELTLRFRDVTDDSEIRLEAPDYTVVDTLAALTADVVTG